MLQKLEARLGSVERGIKDATKNDGGSSGSGGGSGSGGSGGGGGGSGNQRRQNAKKCAHCGRFHPSKPDSKCWNLEANKADRPDGWKLRGN